MIYLFNILKTKNNGKVFSKKRRIARHLQII
jgi:hypothetical protein